MKSKFSYGWITYLILVACGAALVFIVQKFSGRKAPPNVASALQAEVVASLPGSNVTRHVSVKVVTNQPVLAERRAAVVRRNTNAVATDAVVNSDDAVPDSPNGDPGRRNSEASVAAGPSPVQAAAVPVPVSVPDGQAAILGKVVLLGTPPPEKPLPIDLKEPTCGKLHKEVPKTRFYQTSADGGLAEVMVVVRSGPGVDGKTFEPPAEPAHLDQVACEYTPYIMGLQAKQKLLVKNSDPFMHNVNVQPTAAGNKPSNKAQMANAKPFEYAFDNAETFLKFKCDVHPWMFAYVTVVPHPYFAVTDKDGNFTIKNLPPGKYVVEAIHRKTHPNGKGVTQEVTVKAGTVEQIEFHLEAPVD